MKNIINILRMNVWRRRAAEITIYPVFQYSWHNNEVAYRKLYYSALITLQSGKVVRFTSGIIYKKHPVLGKEYWWRSLSDCYELVSNQYGRSAMRNFLLEIANQYKFDGTITIGDHIEEYKP